MRDPRKVAFAEATVYVALTLAIFAILLWLVLQNS